MHAEREETVDDAFYSDKSTCVDVDCMDYDSSLTYMMLLSGN